ncbi:MAG TPA: hypothetical protein VFS05_04555, partial [Gemmatimonadaceae bacterium]|nr:hypothetical protein [Gemmatimonadaceae bacterium]
MPRAPAAGGPWPSVLAAARLLCALAAGMLPAARRASAQMEVTLDAEAGSASYGGYRESSVLSVQPEIRIA